jgi:hypothetical protein
MSDGGDQDLNIRIKTEADLAGANQTADALKKVTDSATDASSASDSLGKSAGSVRSELREFSRSGAETREIIHGLGEASKGGADSIRGMATAARGFFGVLRTGTSAAGPIAWLMIGLGALVGIFMALKGHAEGAGEGLKKTAEGADAAKTALEAMKKDALDSVVTSLEKIKTAADDAIKGIDNLAKARDKIAKSQTDLEIAKIRADTSLTDAEKQQKEFQARQVGEAMEFGAKQADTAKTIAKQQEEIDRQKKEIADRTQVASDARTRAEAAALQLQKDQVELSKLPSATALNQMAVSAAQVGSPEMIARVEQMQGRRGELEKAVGAGGPLVSNLQGQATATQAAADAANKDAQKQIEAEQKKIAEEKLQSQADAAAFRNEQTAQALDQSGKISAELKKNQQEGKADAAEMLRLQEELRKVREKESVIAGTSKPREGFAGIESDFKEAGIGSVDKTGASAKVVESQTELAAKDRELSTKISELSAKEEARKKAEDELKTAHTENTTAIREHTAALRDNTAALRASSGGTIKRGDQTVTVAPNGTAVTSNGSPLTGVPTRTDGQSFPFMDPNGQWGDNMNSAVANGVLPN